MGFWNSDPGFNPNTYAGNGSQDVDAATQQNFIRALQQQALGQGPSAAGLMLQQQAQQQQAQMIAQAAAARGVNPALAMRNAQIQNVQIGQQANQQAALARTHEQLAAQGLLGTTLAQSREQSIQNANNYNTLGLKYNQANTSANTNLAGSIAGGVGSALPYIGGAVAGLAGMFGGGGTNTPATDAGGDLYGPPMPSIDNGGLSGPPPASTTALRVEPASTRGNFAKGGIVDGPKSKVGQHFKGIKMAGGGAVRINMQTGGNVPGTAKVAGNSYSNDTVPATLSPGEVVVPRSVMQSKDPVNAAAQFVAAIMARKGRVA